MYRLGVETILGFTKRGERLFIEPCVPAAWTQFTLEYRYGRTLYVIVVHDPGSIRRGETDVTVDGQSLDAPGILLVDDGIEHAVSVRPRVTTDAATAGRVAAE
jgi:cyclic beta-1,2-glucan synthetase